MWSRALLLGLMSRAVRGELVLVADDDPSILDMVTVNLEVEGFRVVVADDGPKAMQQAVEHVPDLVLLDVVMPGLTGIQVCERLESHPRTRNIPVLMLTASTSTADKVLAFTAGADDYIIKPFDPIELVARVKSTLRRASRMRDLNPLTRLPGNVQITDELAARVARGLPFGLMHIDLDDFKAFNDFYGFLRGDKAIKTLASCVKDAVDEHDPAGFVGHIGGDDFAAIVAADRAESIAHAIIERWDSLASDLYDLTDAEAGHIRVIDRRRQPVEVPLMTVSMGIATNRHRPIFSHLDASETATELKSFVKRKAGSNYAMDRRHQPILLDQDSATQDA